MTGRGLLIPLLIILLFLPFTAAVQEDITHPWIPWEPRPVLGPQKTLIVLVEFSDVRFRSTPGHVASIIDVMAKWFEKSSYGKMTVDYHVYPRALTLPKPMKYYGAPEPEAQRGDNMRRIAEYYRAIFNIIQRETKIDLGDYTHVIIVHAGSDEAVTGNPNEIWSHCICLGPAVERVPQEVMERELKGILYHEDREGRWVRLYGVETVAEEEDMYVLIHEFTHSNGIPDLYIYAADGYSKGSEAGMWSNMDAGAMVGVDIDGWSKYILGWIGPERYRIPVDREVELYTLDNWEGTRAILVEISGEPGAYYFIHARRRAGLDENLPGEGVLVFKVDKTLPRSVEENLLIKLYDANPGTPKECEAYWGDFGMWSVCEKLDAAYNDKESYRWHRFLLNFDNPTFWDPEKGFGIRVLSYDPEKGLFRIRMADAAEEVGAVEKTETTTTTTAEKTERAAQRTDFWTTFLTLTLVTITAAALTAARLSRRKPLPSPPLRINYCPYCGARVYADARYCWRCGAKLRE